MAGKKGYSRLYTAIPQFSGQDGDYYPATKRRLSNHAVAYFLLVLSNIFLFGLWLKGSSVKQIAESTECIRPQLTFLSKQAPTKSTIRYERKRLMRDIDHNIFTGEPRSEHDAAWRKLIEPMTTKISNEDYAKANIGDTLRFGDGSGYVAELSVYHELHCIRRIRRHLYLDHYYPTMSADADELNKEKLHIDHCLEYWREAAMCRGDATLTSMFWRDGLPTSRVYSEHECVEWEALDVWARANMVDVRNLTALDQTHRFELKTTPEGKTVQVVDGAEVHP